MHIQQNISLKPYNTFGIESEARYFVSVNTIEELREALALPKYLKKFLLGGGSNMLLTGPIDALVIHVNLKGISIENENQDHIHLCCMAGENWHDFVLHCIDNNYGGLENMSLIPGNVGTAPIQNIGAYGVELKDVFLKCDAIEIATFKEVSFTHQQCNFGYRNSIFKTTHKGKYVITRVTFKLTKNNHKIQTQYGAINEHLSMNNSTSPTIKQVSDAVIAIRQSKLPDPKKLGNSGSFFKNPVLDSKTFEAFHTKFPEAPFYALANSEFKIPAGWLIEQAGFKAKRYGDAGVHKNQALVLVNYGNATGAQIWELALKIQQKVAKDFGITIEPEVNVF
ncbi:MAG: UDP-N-acetylmuramate dehydrogenase [Patiriisocius sp.]